MRHDPAEVSAAARQRLEQLGRGLGPPRDDPPARPDASVVPEPGRHARPGPGSIEVLRGRVPWSSAHLAVLAVVAAAALVAVAWSVLRAAPTEVAVPSAPTGPAGAATPLLVSATASPTAAAEVVVDIAGKVPSPGVATLPAGSRVVDALRHAGGARAGVDLSTLNLARVLLDGEQIRVGMPAAPAAGTGATAGPGSGAARPGALVSLNSASAEELEGLPGVGPVTAEKIVAWRTEHGGFTAVDELLDVDGIGSKTFAELAPHVTL